jgi:hypothetical protein
MKRDNVLYYREGLTTTVSVHSIPGSDYVYFRSNGKIDGSYGDALSQLMTSYIAMLLHPTAERALTIGLGSGMSAKALATFKSLKSIEIIEIEPAMITASKFFDQTSVALEKLPAGISFPSSAPPHRGFVYDSVSDSPESRIWYNAKEKQLYYDAGGARRADETFGRSRLPRCHRPTLTQLTQLAPFGRVGRPAGARDSNRRKKLYFGHARAV